MGKLSTRKGADGERELVSLLREHGYDVQRGGTQSYGRLPDLYGLPNIHCEVKRAEQLRLSEWMAQAQADAMRFDDGAPVIFWRKNRGAWMAFMLLDDWLDMYDKVNDPNPTESVRKSSSCASI